MSQAIVSQLLGAVSVLAGSVVAYVLAGLNEARRDRRTTERERELRRLDRAASRNEAKHAFQQETLLALQDATQQMARLTGRTMFFDHMNAREGKYTQLPEGYSDEMHANGVEVIRLRNRLLNAELRDKIQDFESLCGQVSQSPSHFKGLEGDQLENAATSRMIGFDAAVGDVMDALGAALRLELAWEPAIDAQ